MFSVKNDMNVNFENLASQIGVKKEKKTVRSYIDSKITEIRKKILSFSRKEYLFFWMLVSVLCLSTLFILNDINNHFVEKVPASGGAITEGVIGTPRFLNPILAVSPVDEDMTSLTYSGLMKKNPDGSISLDLAQKYEISKDGLTYTFTLRDDVYFHDNTRISADDILFTINQMKDPLIKSPQKGNWDGISIYKIDEFEVRFVLKQPYASFLENTTIGIMPEHIWQNIPLELNEANIKPVGSGPYLIDKVNKKNTGIVESYELIPFKKFHRGAPHIKKITFKFYQNEEEVMKALEAGDIEQAGSISPTNAEILKKEKIKVEKTMLPRVFGLFFNQNQNQLFTDKSVISAISLSIDKERIVRDVLLGYGTVIDSPIPKNLVGYEKLDQKTNILHTENVKKAENLLAKNGWKKDENGFLKKEISEKKKKEEIKLEFSISTGNAPELEQSAEIIKQNLEAIGMKVEIKTFDISSLNQNVIRPRKYDTLLFGEIINNKSDLFAFWHSSQIKDPGLNVAMYTNGRVDKILEEAFVTTDESAQVKKYIEFENEIRKDNPAVFIYSPMFIYAISKDLKGFNMEKISSGSERFLNAESWYIDTEKVWKIFVKK